MEPIRHPKYCKAFSRRTLMDIAKTIRNCTINKKSKEIVTRALANYFGKNDPFFDRIVFSTVANGTIEVDPRTEKYSTVKEKQSDQEV